MPVDRSEKHDFASMCHVSLNVRSGWSELETKLSNHVFGLNQKSKTERIVESLFTIMIIIIRSELRDYFVMF